MLTRSRRLSPETRSIALALLCYVLCVTAEIWAGHFANALPDRFLFHCLLGLAILFQTDALLQWQQRKGQLPAEPNHGFLLLLTALGGSVLLLCATIWPALWSGALITCATTVGAGVLVPGLKSRALSEGDGRYRQNQIRAREAGLHALTVLGAVMIILDLSGLIIIPLWLGVGLVLLGVGVAVTGVMWWQERDGGGV
ncbi:hypothetical protein ROE7235_01496 [Roseibaca ekhonensis]|jgi:hypothetical protein|uniref:Uncharacterized protein n=1 Tax=Roseinatronobacter ekhonensis TaxID=254356 RepID=A0A3B0MVA5_9RHOB|nr:hypothetical protein [Roseibaca ekhonensis]SUZ31746.1 hypothetical protein ROE7235_01496 [Roseibaca ekhonensis]